MPVYNYLKNTKGNIMLLNSKWITYKTGEYKSADDKYGNPSPYFRKEFVLSGNVKKAQLYASALGVFKLYINGEAVCDDFLSPGWVDYSKKLPMVCYDVTSFIKDKNAIGAVLGDGWAVGHIGSNYTFKRNGYSDRIEFTAELCVEYDDGHTDNIITDGSWKASELKSGNSVSFYFRGKQITERVVTNDPFCTI